jgi:hypothetical protein
VAGVPGPRRDGRALWRYLYELAPDHHFAPLDEKSESLVAIGNCIPIRWEGNPHTLPDGGVDAVLEDGAVPPRVRGVDVRLS